MTPPRRPSRDAYLEVGDRTRTTIEHALTLDLTPRELRALLAVVHFTTTRSRHGDHVYLAQIAAMAYGVDRAEDWMLPKTRKALARLRTLGVIEVDPPRGRPAEPAYWVGHLDPSEAHVQAVRSEAHQQAALAPRRADRRPPARPANGPPVARPAAGPSTARRWNQHGPPAGRPSPLARPAAGPPTEVPPRFTEEGDRGRNGHAPPGADSVGPADVAGMGEEWSPDPAVDQLTRLLLATLPPDADRYGPDAIEVATIDAHLAEHVPTLRPAIAEALTAIGPLELGAHRLALRTARVTAVQAGHELPRLELPRRVP